MMKAQKRAIIVPKIEIPENSAFRWQVFRQIAPLATRAQNIHDPPQSLLAKLASPVDHFAHVHAAFATLALRRRYQRLPALEAQTRLKSSRGIIASTGAV